MKIDFVSDISCPWCAIGLQALEQALQRLPGLDVQLHFQPFELNPQMAPEGQDLGEHLAQKYGIDEATIARNREAIRQRGAALGFAFRMDLRDRIYNTFDAHRLLHWAGTLDATDAGTRQRRLKHALFKAYFSEGLNPGAREVLLAAAAQAGLDATQAVALLEGTGQATEVRQAQAFYQQHGIHSVPAIIINDRHLIQGGQPPEVFEQVLRQIATQDAAGTAPA